jgi:hypothetical protein
MLIVEIDVIRTEAFQRGIASSLDIICTAFKTLPTAILAASNAKESFYSETISISLS